MSPVLYAITQMHLLLILVMVVVDGIFAIIVNSLRGKRL